MKTRLSKLATAAAVIIVLGFIGLIDLLSPGNGGGGKVWADVLEQIQEARTVTYKETFEYDGERPSFTTEVMIMEPGHLRTVFAHGTISIWDCNKGIRLQLEPGMHKALIVESVGRAPRKRLFNYLKLISKFHERGGQFDGQEEIDGQIADVFVADKEFEKTTVWVDPQTNLPIRVEQVDLPHPNKDVIMPQMNLSLGDFGGAENEGTTIVIGGGRGIQEKMTLIYSDFVWNADLDESLFSLEVPEGYTSERRQDDQSPSDEVKLVKALGLWTEMSGGSFPEKINDLAESEEMLIEKFDKDGPPKQEYMQALAAMGTILKGLYFAQNLKTEDNWHYGGTGVQLGDGDTPVCWWRLGETETCRVIFGDLSVSDVETADLSELLNQ